MLVTDKVYKSKAKINLFLHVLSKEEKVFHNLQSITYFPNIYDTLSFSIKDIFCENYISNTINATGEFADFLPRPKNNSIIKVIEFFQDTFSISDTIQVELKKNLPIGGGIGGGSSNTAVTILALNEIFSLGLSFVELLDIAKKFGSDVPVCMYQNSCIFEGKGEQTTPIELPEIAILLINPKEPLLTSKVFKTFDALEGANSSEKIENLKNLKLNNFDDLINFLATTKNDLLDASVSLNKNIANILASLNSYTNPTLARMTGSGSTCFAIYNKVSDLQMAKKTMKALYPKAWVVSSRL